MPAFLDVFTDCVIILNNSNSQSAKPDDPRSARTINTKANLTEWFFKFIEKVKELMSKTDKEQNWPEVSCKFLVD